ncbi:MAG: S-layer homology domain-containing protein [Patescibacteria group bacterium]
MKKLFLVFAGLLLSSTSVFAASFPDVAEDHKNYKAIEFLDEKQIVKGYPDGTFAPDKLVTRAEALKMIIGATGIKFDGQFDVIFPDVKKEDWFFGYVMAAKTQGLIKGYDDGKFKPHDTVNLAENLKMLILAAKVQVPGSVSADVYTDVKKDDWFAPYALYSRNHNMIFSDDYGKLLPNQAMTRAAFAELVYRMMVVKDSKEQPFPLDLSWREFESKTVPAIIKYDDKTWKLIENKDSLVFFKPDKEYLQFSPNRIYNNTGVVEITLDPNEGELVEDQYFTNLKAAFATAKFKKFTLGGLTAFEVLFEADRKVDWYIYLEDGRVLAVYTEYGPGPLGYQIQQVIKSMLNSLKYHELPEGEDYSQLLSEILKNVLIEGKGMEMVNSLPDELIIETDGIGVGTGPVDYYFSAKVDYTFKYERSKDVILDTRKGNTSAF